VFIDPGTGRKILFLTGAGPHLDHHLVLNSITFSIALRQTGSKGVMLRENILQSI
jgi:hypothetical protein